MSKSELEGLINLLEQTEKGYFSAPMARVDNFSKDAK